MDQKLECGNSKMFTNFELALKGLDRVSEIAVKMGTYQGEVDRLKEKQLKELHTYFLNRYLK
jgi:hypothetical protein